MNMSRQLINLAGGLAVIVILALGIALVALPMFNQAGATGQQADDIAQTNDIYEIQVQTLRAQEADLAALEGELAELRDQIPATALNDQVYELIGAAAAESGVIVESVAAGAPEPWTAATADGTPAEAPAAEVPASDTPASDTAAPEAGADADAATGAAAEETAPAPEVDPQQAVPVTITVMTQDAAQAARFIDAVRGAERLLSIEHAVVTGEEGGLRLVVNARSLLLVKK